MFAFTKYSTYYYIFSGVLIAASLVCLFVFGLRFGIEFTGGSTMEIEFTASRPTNTQVQEALASFNLGEVVTQPTGEKGMVLKFKEVNEQTHQKILEAINNLSAAQERSFQFIGPSVGKELKNKTIAAIILALAAITLYIAFAFRKVSRPVTSWKYGVTSLVALFHDILIPLGVFALLGKFYHAEITIPIIAALLTVVGFSVHDTIVIFDRIRENILRQGTGQFQETVDNSLSQTVGRSISTVVTTLLVMVAVFFFGGETLKWFSLALIVGISAGAYSSIFIAGPLLVTWHKWSERRSQ